MATWCTCRTEQFSVYLICHCFLKGLSKNNKITPDLSPSSFLPALPHLKVIIFMCSQGDLLRTLQVHGINLHILSLGINGVSGEFAEKTQVIK